MLLAKLGNGALWLKNYVNGCTRGEKCSMISLAVRTQYNILMWQDIQTDGQRPTVITALIHSVVRVEGHCSMMSGQMYFQRSFFKVVLKKNSKYFLLYFLSTVLLHCALASCGAVYCNRSCLCVCGGRAGGVKTLLQPARAQCLRLSERFFILYFENTFKKYFANHYPSICISWTW